MTRGLPHHGAPGIQHAPRLIPPAPAAAATKHTEENMLPDISREQQLGILRAGAERSEKARHHRQRQYDSFHVAIRRKFDRSFFPLCVSTDSG